MRKILAAGLIILFGCLVSQADTVDLRPNADTQVNWGVIGSGTGDCTTNTAEYGCVNSDVESPEDGTFVVGTSPTHDGTPEEFEFENAPGDCGSVNSITLKVRTSVNADTAEDQYDVWLEVSGTQSGGTKTIDNWSGAATCNLSGTAISNCSFTDSTWDTWSCSDVTNASVVLDTVTNNNGMPDNTAFEVREIEIVLNYNIAGADDTVLQIIMIGELQDNSLKIGPLVDNSIDLAPVGSLVAGR